MILPQEAGSALAAQTAEEAAPSSTRAESNGSGAKRVNPLKVKKLRDRLGQVEQEVAAIESEIAQHEAELAAFTSVEETMRLNDLVIARRRDLEARVAEWEQLSAELEATA